MALIVVEHREGQIVDVGRNAEAEHQHQERRTEQGERQTDGIAQKLDRFADRVGEQPLQAERALPRRAAAPAVGRAGRYQIAGVFGARPAGGRFQIADKGVFKRGDAARLDEVLPACRSPARARNP